MTEYIYVWVRTDIPLAQQVVQACHASVLAGRDFRHSDETHLVLLECKNSRDLFKVTMFLHRLGIKFQIFYEPDLHEGKEIGYTAIATEIVQENQCPEFFRYNLWRDPNDRDNPTSSRRLFPEACRSTEQPST